jgi:transaldolase|tara:strand:+ start:2181 stop:2882 length:702 start_codon:yes stop_codon:yes gene_type:complete
MKIKIFLDGANLEEILKYKDDDQIKGFTTNPTLMRKAGVKNYMEFVHQLANEIPKEKHVSLEVISDDFTEMERQARKITSVSENFYAKIPITNTKGEPCHDLVKSLGDDGIKVNVTAIMTSTQLNQLAPFLSQSTPSVVSYFAGRVSDTGEAAISTVLNSHSIFKNNESVEFLWASCRHVYNIYEADSCGCNIITVSSDILSKLKLKGKSLTEYSLETVKGFYDDALASNYSL